MFLLLTFSHISSVSIVDFEQVNVIWKGSRRFAVSCKPSLRRMKVLFHKLDNDKIPNGAHTLPIVSAAMICICVSEWCLMHRMQWKMISAASASS